MFPIGDDQVKGGYKPIFTWVFIIINIVVFMYQLGLSDTGLEEFFMTYATVPAKVMQGDQRYSLLTSMFMHGGWMHIIGNMLFLHVFGDNIEARIGNMKFLIFYLTTGLLASLSHILTDTASMVPSLGASGAISGVLGAYLVMYPGSRVKMWDPRLGTTYWPASSFLLYWIGIQVFSGFGSLAAAGDGASGGTAWFAHIGGFAAGWLRGKISGKNYTTGQLVSSQPEILDSNQRYNNPFGR